MGRARAQSLQEKGPGLRHTRSGKPVVWPVGMYGTPIAMRQDQVTARDFEVFFAALKELSGGAVEIDAAKEVLDQLLGPNAETSCERWEKGFNGAPVPMRENAITSDDEDILTEFFAQYPRLGGSVSVEFVLQTVLGI
jgi:hypothetical protein